MFVNFVSDRTLSNFNFLQTETSTSKPVFSLSSERASCVSRVRRRRTRKTITEILLRATEIPGYFEEAKSLP